MANAENLDKWLSKTAQREREAIQGTWHECLERQSFYGLAHVMQSLVLDGEPGITERNVQLVVVACARHVEHLLANDLYRRTIQLAEEATDSELLQAQPLATYAEIRSMLDEYGPAPDFLPRMPHDPLTQQALELAADLADPEQIGARVRYMGGHAAHVAAIASGDLESNPEALFQIAAHRDIFGNLFQRVALDPAWQTSTVLAIAQGMHESRDFSAMPILADALQDAGCENEDILNHCRDEKQVHVRGCWVVDLVLGKA